MTSRWMFAAVVLSLLGISGAPARSLAQAKAPAEAKAPAQAPAPDKPQANTKLLEFPEGTPTEVDYWQGWTDFYLEAIKKYEKDSTDSAAIKADIRKLVEQSLAMQVARHRRFEPPQADWDAALKLADQLYKRGNRNPLLLHYSGVLLVEQGQLPTAKSRFNDCRTALEKSGDPYDLLFPALYQVHRLNNLYGSGPNIKTSQKRLAEELPNWLALGDKSPQARRYIWHLTELTYDIFGDNQAPFLEVCAQQKNQDPWLWSMLQGYHHIKTGWKHRGGEFAHAVTEDGWKKLSDHMNQASKHLREAYQLFPQYPEAATHLIAVAMAGHEADSEQVWCNRAIAAQCDYLPAIHAFNLALWPRWGGSHEAMLLLGEDCARNGRYDTSTPHMYVEILESVVMDARISREDLLNNPNHPGIYDKIHYVINRLVEHPSRDGKNGELSNEQAYYLTQLLGYALHVDRLEDAVELTKRLGDKIQPHILRQMDGLKADFNISRLYAYDHFGDELVSIQKTAFKEARSTAAGSRKRQQLMQEMLDRSAVPESRLFFETWIRWMQLEQDFHEGKWVDLTFDPEFTDWNSGNLHLWTYESPRSAVGSNMSPHDTNILGYHLAHSCFFPGPREMECTVEVLSNYSYGNNMGFGFFIGRPIGSLDSGLFWVNPVKNAVGNSQVLNNRVLFTEFPKTSKVNRLKVKIWGQGYYEYYGGNNWELDFKNAQVMHLDDSQDATRSMVILGSLWWRSGPAKVRVSDVRVRKLGDRPPDSYLTSADDQATIQYFTKALEEEPEFAWHYIRRGLAYSNVKEFTLSAADLEKGLALISKEPNIRHVLGVNYLHLDKYREGLAEMEQSFKDTPTRHKYSTYSSSGLAYYLATLPIDEMRDGKRALEIAQKHCTATRNKSFHGLTALAAAHAETGNFAEALKALDKAQAVAADKRERAWVKAFREKYEAKQPWRFDPKRTEP